MGVVSEIERQLARLRAPDSADEMPELRTSTMTHIVWCPRPWLPRARATLAGLVERQPARTIFLIPEPGRKSDIEAQVELRDFQVPGLSRELRSEVIEITLRGPAARHPASIVRPLLVSDLPVFCRWRGEPAWESNSFAELIGVVDRLAVDSAEWRRVPRSYAPLATLFDRVCVSDIAFSRSLPWRMRLAELWPEIADVQRLRVEGPRADAELIAGWLRSRLESDVSLTRRDAKALTSVWVDGEAVTSPGKPLAPSELLSAVLDQFGRDPVYEAAVRAVGAVA